VSLRPIRRAGAHHAHGDMRIHLSEDTTRMGTCASTFRCQPQTWVKRVQIHGPDSVGLEDKRLPHLRAHRRAALAARRKAPALQSLQSRGGECRMGGLEDGHVRDVSLGIDDELDHDTASGVVRASVSYSERTDSMIRLTSAGRNSRVPSRSNAARASAADRLGPCPAAAVDCAAPSTAPSIPGFPEPAAAARCATGSPPDEPVGLRRLARVAASEPARASAASPPVSEASPSLSPGCPSPRSRSVGRRISAALSTTPARTPDSTPISQRVRAGTTTVSSVTSETRQTRPGFARLYPEPTPRRSSMTRQPAGCASCMMLHGSSCPRTRLCPRGRPRPPSTARP